MSIDGLERTQQAAAIANEQLAEPNELTDSAPSRSEMIRHKLGQFGASALILLPAAGAGAATAINIAEAPVAISTGIPGIEIDAKPQLADYLAVEYGPIVGFPAAHTSVLGINISARLDVKKFGTSGNIDQRAAAAAIFEDPKRTIGPPARSAFLRREVEGLAGGLGAFGILAGAGFHERRRRKKQENDDDNKRELLLEIANTPKDPGSQLSPTTLERSLDKLAELEEKQERHPHRRLANKLGTLALAASILAGSGLAASHAIDNLRPDDSSRTVIFPSTSGDPMVREILADNPSLKNAFITGDAGYLAQKGLFWLATYKQKKDALWQNAAATFTSTTLPDFRAKGGMDWQDNPDIVAFAEVTDIHDSQPELKYFLPSVFKDFGVSFVVNTGDEMNFSNQLFLDNGAWQRFADALPKTGPTGKPVKAIVAAGNHDNVDSSQAHKLTLKTSDGKSYHPLIPLDKSNGYTTTIDGIPFVGSPDLNRTNAGGTTPASREDQLANDAKQGELLAKQACKTYDETGQKPIVLAHEQEASFQSLAKGCVALALSGHLHETLATRSFVNLDGSLAYQQTLGSASGDGPNNATVIYNYATTKGAIRIWLYNRASGSLVDHYITLNIGPDGQSMDSQKLPSPKQAVEVADSQTLDGFFATYQPDFLTEEHSVTEDNRAQTRLSGRPLALTSKR